MKYIVKQLCKLAENPRALVAMVAWPTFAMSTYLLVKKIAMQGLLPRTIIDVGANDGQFAMAAAKTFRNVRIHSFEPHPGCFARLGKNTQNLPMISLYPVALGEREGVTDININTMSYSSSILPLAKAHQDAFPHAVESHRISVAITTLDKALKDVKLVGPCLLKMDVQGYEAHVISGSSEVLSKVDYVLLETSFKQMYEGESLFHEIVGLMEKAGFDFLRPIDFLADPNTDEILQSDVLFVRRRA